MEYELRANKQTLIVSVRGELDHHYADMIRQKIDGELLSVRFKNLVFDFSGLTFMDSSGIGLVMGRYKLMKSLGGKIRVQNLSPGAYKVMCLAGIERLGEVKQKEVI